jgi:peptide chain release factor 2
VTASSSFEIVFDLATKQRKMAEIEARMAAPEFWNNQERARETMGELKTLKSVVVPMEESLKATADLKELLVLAEEDEAEIASIREELTRLDSVVDEIELKSLLNGPHDADGALISIYARDGGTDAHDWAEMLLRMYTQWAQKNGYSASVIDREDNMEAGINRATLSIQGPMAFGYLKGETGIHRLVRISPFNSEGKRQTSFAAVDVAPDINDDIVVDIKDDDLRIDKFCSSGAGGQHVNKTASAIRITHLPTNIVVQCQNERSQHKNLAFAMKMLRAKLIQREEEKREAEEAAKYQNKARVGFGSQIRNYFLHPDQRVKDVRTGFAMTNFHTVMDGNIQGFLDSMLRWRVSQDAPALSGEDA